MPDRSTIILATRGSALALAQAGLIVNHCRIAFPGLRFELKVIKTTGDKLQSASLSQRDNLAKGLFTKELEVALLNGDADFAVHSLKDLPTELPAGLKLGAVSRRADVHDVLIAGSRSAPSLKTLRPGAVIGTSSTRRRAQLLAKRPDLNLVKLRGNIITRLQKLSGEQGLDAIVLAAAGLERMGFQITSDHRLLGGAVPAGLFASQLDLDTMLPCVGQGALGIEVRENDECTARICGRLNHSATAHCVTAERSFLAEMGGGCASPVAAYAEVSGSDLQLRAISFPDGVIHRAFGTSERKNAAELGRQLAEALRRGNPALAGPDRAPGSSSLYAHREPSTRL